MARVYILAIILIAAFSMAIWKPTNAFFTDAAVASANTFAAASVFPSSNPSITATETPSESPAPEQNIANHLVISEIQIAGENSDDDFIEMYNPTNSSISLNNHRLVKRSNTGTVDLPIKTFGAGDSIPAHGYYLWSNTGIATAIGANASTSATIAASNSIALRNGPENIGEIVDAVGWGTLTGNPLSEGTTFSPNPVANQSIERKALISSTTTSMSSGGSDELKGNGFDSGNNNADFVLRTTDQPQNSGSTAEAL